MDVIQPSAAGDLAGASGSMRDALARLVRTAALVTLTAVFAACAGSGLSSGEWTWCKENPAAVDAAALNLNVARAQRTFKEPTWWQDYLTSVASQNDAALQGNADFAASCNAAQVKSGVDTANVAWCSTDGIGETWDGAVSLSLMTDVDATTFAFEALPLRQRINNADFDSACTMAYGTRPD